MKARILLLASIVLLGAAAEAGASPVSIGVQGGLTAPSGDLARAVGAGLHIGISVSSPIDPREGIGVEANYHVFGEETTTTRLLGFPMTIRTQLSFLETALYYRGILAPTNARVAPYLKAGFGVDYLRSDDTITIQGSSGRSIDWQFWPGILGGVGVWIRPGDATPVCLEVLFRQIVTNKPANMVTVTLGIRSSGDR